MMKKKIYEISTILLAIVLSIVYYNSFANADISLIMRVRGKILLQVEENGEAWYVSPLSDERYFLSRPNNALDIMKNLGVGIDNEDLKKIPIADSNITGVDTDNDGLSDLIEDSFGTDINKIDTDNDGYSDKEEILNGYDPLGEGSLPIDENFAKKQAGKIMLQVLNNGEGWYVNPDDNKRYYLGRPADAFSVMRELGLGVTNSDLAQIPKFIVNESVRNDAIVKNNTIEVSDDPTKRKYTDPIYPYSLEYPKEWKAKKDEQFDYMLFLGDYTESPFSEKKAMLAVNYITVTQSQKDRKATVDDFKIPKKEGAEKIYSKKLVINGYDAIQERFDYDGSFEIATIIENSNKEFLHILLVSAGDENYYKSINEDIVYSVEFMRMSDGDE